MDTLIKVHFVLTNGLLPQKCVIPSVEVEIASVVSTWWVTASLAFKTVFRLVIFLFHLVFSFLFFWYRGLNVGLWACKAGSVTTELNPWPIKYFLYVSCCSTSKVVIIKRWFYLAGALHGKRVVSFLAFWVKVLAGVKDPCSLGMLDGLSQVS